MVGQASATALLQLCEKHQVKVAALYNQIFDKRKDGDELLTEPGWCLGMVAQWLTYAQQGKDQAFWREMESGSLIPSLRPIMARQALVLKQLKDQSDSSIHAEVGFTLWLLNAHQPKPLEELLKDLKEVFLSKQLAIPFTDEDLPLIRKFYKLNQDKSQDAQQSLEKFLNHRGCVKVASHKSSKDPETEILNTAFAASGDYLSLKVILHQDAHIMGIKKYPDNHYSFLDSNGGEFLFDNPEQFKAWFKEYLELQKYFISLYTLEDYRSKQPSSSLQAFNGEIPDLQLFVKASIARIKANDPNFTNLNLSGIPLAKQAVLELTEALRKNTALREIRVENCSLSAQEVENLCQACLEKNNQIQILNFANNNLAGSHLGETLDKLSKNLAELRGLNLRNCELGSSQIGALLPLLRESTHLQELDTDGNGLAWNDPVYTAFHEQIPDKYFHRFPRESVEEDWKKMRAFWLAKTKFKVEEQMEEKSQFISSSFYSPQGLSSQALVDSKKEFNNPSKKL